MIRQPKKFLEPSYGPRNPDYPIPATMPVDPNDWEGSRPIHNAFCVKVSHEMLKESGKFDEIFGNTTMEPAVITERNVPVNVYHPVKRTCDALMLYFHGGSFCMNDPSVLDTACRTWVNDGGYSIISVDYKLAPQYLFPEGLEDCYSVLLWAREHAKEMGCDPEKIFVAGDSSGGNFAAVIAQMARDRKGPAILGQVLIYPCTVLQPEERTKSELLYGTNHLLNYDSSVNPFAHYLNTDSEKYHPYVSPMYADTLAGLPDAMVAVAGCDPLLDQGLQYAQALHEDGVNVTCKIFEGMLHGFIIRTYPECFELSRDVASFVCSHC